MKENLCLTLVIDLNGCQFLSLLVPLLPRPFALFAHQTRATTSYFTREVLFPQSNSLALRGDRSARWEARINTPALHILDRLSITSVVIATTSISLSSSRVANERCVVTTPTNYNSCSVNMFQDNRTRCAMKNNKTY